MWTILDLRYESNRSFGASSCVAFFVLIFTLIAQVSAASQVLTGFSGWIEGEVTAKEVSTGEIVIVVNSLEADRKNKCQSVEAIDVIGKEILLKRSWGLFRERQTEWISELDIGDFVRVEAVYAKSSFGVSYLTMRSTFRLFHVDDKNSVVFAGDSIVNWWASLASQFPQSSIYNSGVAGGSSRTLKKRLDWSVLNLNPSAVVIMIGINDLNAKKRRPVVTEEIVQLIHRKDPGVPVILCEVLPCKDCRGKDLIPELNAYYKQLASKKQNIEFCETYDAFVTEGGVWNQGLFRDGVHPNQEGYKVLAGQVRESFCRLGLEGEDNGECSPNE